MLRNNTNLLINCDMGEWDAPHLTPQDEKIMPYIELCNIACGGHAGSSRTIAMTINLANQYNVKIGAHPGLEDRDNFGRKYISHTRNELADSLRKQLKVFLSECGKANAVPYHIKAHGALYHACNQKDLESEVFIDVIQELCPQLVILLAPNSILESKARKVGLSALAESFVDRRYNNDLSLVSRTDQNAVISNTTEAKSQFDALTKGEVVTISGAKKKLLTDTACIHGDNPECIQILKTIRNA